MAAVIIGRRSLLHSAALQKITGCQACAFSTTAKQYEKKKFPLLIIGGGAGGQAMSYKLLRTFGKGNVAVMEPSDVHYYQPLWTLVGSGFRKYKDSHRPMKGMFASGVVWLKDGAERFDPENNTVVTQNGDEISYDYLIVAVGITTRYDMVKGLEEALAKDPRVCSNFHPEYVQKTFPAIKNFNEGNAIFTFPATPIKCAGAPQKILYVTEEYLRKFGKRDKATVMYQTSLPVIFGIPRYAAVLNKLAQRRGIEVHQRSNLVEVKPDTHEAVFENLSTKELTTYKYEMLHVSPPCSAPASIKGGPLADEVGFLDLNKTTLQHSKYANVFGIGDCTSLPTAKTAAAVASQSGHLMNTIQCVMEGKDITTNYNGYTSCPLVTGKNKTILAEFGYDAVPLETFPFDQRKERLTMFLLKKWFMPVLYWVGLVRGYWSGPSTFQKVFSKFRFSD